MSAGEPNIPDGGDPADEIDPATELARLRRTVERLRGEVEAERASVEALRSTRATMHAIIEVADAAIFAKDLDGRYLLANPRGTELVGLSPEDVIGRTDAELYEPEPAARFRALDLEVIESGRGISTMVPIPTPDGDEVWLSHLVPLVDDSGKIYGTAGIATDISVRAQHEELLQQRTRELETAQRIARLGTWTWEPATGHIEVSDELARILGGVPAGGWTVRYLDSLTHPDDRDAAFAAVRAAGQGADIDHVFRVRLGDGQVRWLRFRSEAAHGDLEGGTRVLGTVQDVTEREEAEQRRVELEHRLQQSQRLETVGQLAGGLAHDFNNLLAVMGMQSELALHALDPHHPAAQHLAELRVTVEQASALTQQLLVFSRHERYDDTVIELPALLERLGPLLSRSLGTHIDLEVDLAPDLKPVLADRSQIEQVLVNLAVNSRDAMPDGGTLTITGSNIEADEPWVRLVVADDGTGMQPADVERAFEPFFTTKPPGLGTGLGLATVHGVVTRAGGTVELRSQWGAGTTVEIVLPASADLVPRHATPPPAPPTSAPGRTVLIVEDLEPLGRLCATVLGRAGYRTLLAKSGAEALELVGEHTHVDLLLTDVVMPEMSGRELAERVRAANRAELPVVFMTGYTAGMLDLGDREQVVVLSKPFTTAELVAAVSNQLAPPAP